MDRLLSGRRVLVVEDEMLVVMMIEDMLADLGCQSVTSAATVDKALALIDAQVFDAAMLDMNLNGNDSQLVAEALSARGVLFVYSTGNTGHSLREGYFDQPVLKSHSSMRSWPRYLPASSSHRSSDNIVKGAGGTVTTAAWGSCFNTTQMSTTRRPLFSLYSPTEGRRRGVR
jgi:CheY-like chemotaxis protein